MSTQAYRMLNDSSVNKTVLAGTTVFKATGYDYGLARDDTNATGVEHISVTLRRNGGYPLFTVPLSDLEPIKLEPLPKLDLKHIGLVCIPGAGKLTCRYLVSGSKGFECAKHTPLANSLDFRVSDGRMTAKGDNCEGRE